MRFQITAVPPPLNNNNWNYFVWAETEDEAILIAARQMLHVTRRVDLEHRHHRYHERKRQESILDPRD